MQSARITDSISEQKISAFKIATQLRAIFITDLTENKINEV